MLMSPVHISSLKVMDGSDAVDDKLAHGDHGEVDVVAGFDGDDDDEDSDDDGSEEEYDDYDGMMRVFMIVKNSNSAFVAADTVAVGSAPAVAAAADCCRCWVRRWFLVAIAVAVAVGGGVVAILALLSAQLLLLLLGREEYGCLEPGKHLASTADPRSLAELHSCKKAFACKHPGMRRWEVTSDRILMSGSRPFIWPVRV